MCLQFWVPVVTGKAEGHHSQLGTWIPSKNISGKSSKPKEHTKQVTQFLAMLKLTFSQRDRWSLSETPGTVAHVPNLAGDVPAMVFAQRRW